MTDAENSPEVDSVKAEVVKTMVLEKRVIDRTIEYHATLTAFEEVHLASASPGKIEKIHVETGSRVKKGDLLVQMDQSQLQQARYQLNNLETDFRRLDTLNKTGSIAKQKYDQIKTQHEVARTNVQFLEKNTFLQAPFSGIISGKYYEDGEMFSGSPNTPAGKAAIVSLVQVSPLKALVNVSEKYFPRIKKGMKVNIKSDIYPDETFQGEVFRIYPTIDQTTRSFTIEVKVQNPGEILRPGMFSRASIAISESETLMVPAVAVLKLQGTNERYLFLEKNGRAKRVTVELGKRLDDLVEVISNEIKPGDHLVISGQARILDQMPLKVIN